MKLLGLSIWFYHMVSCSYNLYDKRFSCYYYLNWIRDVLAMKKKSINKRRTNNAYNLDTGACAG